MLEQMPFSYSAEDYQKLAWLLNSIYTFHPTDATEIRVEDENFPDRELQRYFYQLGDLIVGMGELRQVIWSKEPTLYDMFFMVVSDFQGRGFGNFIYDHLIGLKTKFPIKKLGTDTCSLFKTGPPFLEKRGFTLGTREFCSSLNLGSWLARKYLPLLEKKQRQGFQFISYSDLSQFGIDDFQLYTLLSTLDRDVPWHEPHEPESFTQWQQRTLRNNRLAGDLSIVAIDAKGTLAAASELEYRYGKDTYLYHGLTGVLPAFRRQGLASATKVASFLKVRRLAPHITQIWTENEEDNPMYQLNVKLGFKHQFDWLFYQKIIGNS